MIVGEVSGQWASRGSGDQVIVERGRGGIDTTWEPAVSASVESEETYPEPETTGVRAGGQQGFEKRALPPGVGTCEGHRTVQADQGDPSEDRVHNSNGGGPGLARHPEWKNSGQGGVASTERTHRGPGIHRDRGGVPSEDTRGKASLVEPMGSPV